MPTFTPPTILVIPPINISDTKTGPTTLQANPGGYNLMKYFPMRYRGVNVWKMNDGTYQMSDPVPGVDFLGVISYPYPDAVPNTNGAAPFPGQDNPVNNAISSSWFPGGPGGVGSSGPGGLIQLVIPGIAVEYLGGHSYVVSSIEQADLAAVGLGAFVI